MYLLASTESLPLQLASLWSIADTPDFAGLGLKLPHSENAEILRAWYSRSGLLLVAVSMSSA